MNDGATKERKKLSEALMDVQVLVQDQARLVAAVNEGQRLMHTSLIEIQGLLGGRRNDDQLRLFD